MRRYIRKDHSFFKGEHNHRYEAIITVALHSVAFQPEFESSLYYGMREYTLGYNRKVCFTVASPYFEDFRHVLEVLLEKHDFDGIYWRDYNEDGFMDHPKFKSYTKNTTHPIDAIINYLHYDSKMEFPGKMLDITAWIDCNPDGSIT